MDVPMVVPEIHLEIPVIMEVEGLFPEIAEVEIKLPRTIEVETRADFQVPVIALVKALERTLDRQIDSRTLVGFGSPKEGKKVRYVGTVKNAADKKAPVRFDDKTGHYYVSMSMSGGGWVLLRPGERSGKRPGPLPDKLKKNGQDDLLEGESSALADVTIACPDFDPNVYSSKLSSLQQLRQRLEWIDKICAHFMWNKEDFRKHLRAQYGVLYPYSTEKHNRRLWKEILGSQTDVSACSSWSIEKVKEQISKGHAPMLHPPPTYSTDSVPSLPSVQVSNVQMNSGMSQMELKDDKRKMSS
eukprot:GILK01003338.1.p1 GENE.GILK01003338.1~~GILK01003338.1.p1  ORF type:complete len:300 (+),score=38.60 GILK01003338.1:88-987(+)